ncbi:MAG: peptidase domain-containing ABC transporter, partial [Clostridiales Family XIII bacterium]|nr:peptidase domain-containing ABC transporter [Clostridiales Family XIII bacterium]
MKYFCVKQHDITDCAAACLATVCKQYGRTVSLSRTRRTAGTDTMGTNVYGIIKAAQQMGFTANSVRGDRDAFFSEFPLPAIAHIITEDGLSHYVVIHKVTESKLLIADPAKGLRKMAPEEFFKLWTGVLVLLVPESTFQKGKETKNIFERFWGLLLPQKRMVAGIFVSSLIITALGILAAFYFQIIMDYIVPRNDGELLFVISVAAIFLYLFSVLLSMGRTRLFLKLSQKLDLALLLGYYNHVLELPMDFFGTRKTGEIISRFQDATSIRTAISQATLSAMIDTLMAVAGGIILYYKNPVLFLITLAIAGCYAVIVLLFNKPYREANRQQLEDNAQLTSYLVESLNGIQTVKAFNGEGQVKGETDRRFKKLLRSIFRLGEIGNLQTALKSGVQMIGGVVIIWIGASYVLAGEMTLGSLMTFNALLVYFLTPIKNLIDLQPTMQTALVASDRLGEILDLDPEKGADEGEKAAPASLKGDICFEHVSFRYGTRELVLKDFSLDIKQGERIAIVGESGAGKTTIAKLLLHFYSCEAGSLRIGGQD